MGGLYKLFLKITPIMLLICCICYGIIQVFQRPNEPNITYLTTETINIGTEENPDNKILYKFDMINYTQNIDQDILKRSITKTIDLESYTNQLNSFKAIWDDGYQIFDVSKTIANGIVTIINSLLLPINILLVPLRIIAGILLTGMSLVGINIDNGEVIIPFLKFILDHLAIPIINLNTTINADTLKGKTYQLNNNIHLDGKFNKKYIYFTFKTASNDIYIGMYTETAMASSEIWYIDEQGNETRKYLNGWSNQNDKIITIEADQQITGQNATLLEDLLGNYAEEIQNRQKNALLYIENKKRLAFC